MLRRTLQYIFIAIVLGSLSKVSAHSYEIKGNIFDSNQVPVKGVLVTVTCNGLSKSSETSGGGLYTVNFSLEQCPVDALIHVLAIIDNNLGEGTANASGENIRLNLELNPAKEVPEFGNIYLAVIAGLGIASYFKFSKAYGI